MSCRCSSAGAARWLHRATIAVALVALWSLLSAGSSIAASFMTPPKSLFLNAPYGTGTASYTLTLSSYTIGFGNPTCSPLSFTGPEPSSMGALDFWAANQTSLTTARLTDRGASKNTRTYTFQGAVLASITSSVTLMSRTITGQITYSGVTIKDQGGTTFISCFGT